MQESVNIISKTCINKELFSFKEVQNVGLVLHATQLLFRQSIFDKTSHHRAYTYRGR